MAVINPDWYSENEQREYPIDTFATRMPDSGNGDRLPEDLLVDAKFSLPSSMAAGFIFVSTVALTPTLATVTFSAAPSATTESPDFVPVGTVSLRRPVDIYRVYTVDTYDPLVYGWVVFGSGANAQRTYSMRFSNPAQSVLCGRCVTRSTPAPIAAMGRVNSRNLVSEIVTLQAAGDVKITTENRAVPTGSGGYVCMPVILLSLAKETRPTVMQDYAGPCAANPDTGTCPRTPIRTINSIPPDCSGNINLQFEAPIIQHQVDFPAQIIRSAGRVLINPNATGPRGAVILLNSVTGLASLCPVEEFGADYSIADDCISFQCGAEGRPLPVEQAGDSTAILGGVVTDEDDTGYITGEWEEV